MSANPSDPLTWTPVGETSTDILNDAVNLVSTIICGVGYGIAFTLYCICARTLCAQLRFPDKQRQAMFMLTYITIITLCGGLYLASASRVAQLAYVDFRNYPGGPYAYTLFIFSAPDNLLGVCSYFIVSWLTDAMIIWRVYILFSSRRYPWLVIAFPCILYLASFCMGVVIIFQSSRPSQSFWSSAAIPFGLAYYVLTAVLTIIATILMTFRLLMARRQFIRAMGNSPHARQYLSIATMLIESSALYAIWSIIFIGLYIVNHPMQSVFLGTLTDISIIALLLIIFRVSQGQAWKANTEQALTTTHLSWRTSTTTRGSTRYVKPSFQTRDDGSTTRFEDSVTVETFTVDDNKKRVEV
ncbi:hypothetical protein P691DRAFT_709869 [Macrolepiota fuliginosa MF-IS2]|uniref:Uncharacterized protein n=1 Tax=Macrolepiota fuliginosa MF-IS2 TaxID=1400762 RepID=A0A9P5X769_9AGAR|nr:hypothetical protein P691DRAFT_709869 [Macrolepiota fuliginosa MF-IS2]